MLYNGLFGEAKWDFLPGLDINQTKTSNQKASPNNQSLELITDQLTTSNALGYSNPTYYLSIAPVGEPLRRDDIFRTTLESLLIMAQRDVDSEIDEMSLTSEIFPVWLLGKAYPHNTPHFKVTTFHMILIAEAIAKHCVVNGVYRELTWDLHVDGAVAARGCLTLPIASRVDCEGLGAPLDTSSRSVDRE